MVMSKATQKSGCKVESIKTHTFHSRGLNPGRLDGHGAALPKTLEEVRDSP